MSLDSNQKIIIEGVGEVLVKRRRGLKRTTLRISQKGEVVIGTNYSTPVYALKKFITEQASWIEEVKLKNGLNEEIVIYDGQILGGEVIFKLKEDSLEFSAKYSSSKKEILLRGLVEDGAKC